MLAVLRQDLIHFASAVKTALRLFRFVRSVIATSVVSRNPKLSGPRPLARSARRFHSEPPLLGGVGSGSTLKSTFCC